jgi:rhodanese-related sulfurtransferase
MTAPSRTVEDVLTAARSRLTRLTPAQAASAAARGALLVDTRPIHQRIIEGEVPGALVLERNVLEWRLDPSSAAAVPEAAHELFVIVLCSEGYSSSLAAAALMDLGVFRATDVIGGVRAWDAAGLPLSPGGTPAGSRSPAASPAEVVTSA